MAEIRNPNLQTQGGPNAGGGGGGGDMRTTIGFLSFALVVCSATSISSSPSSRRPRPAPTSQSQSAATPSEQARCHACCDGCRRHRLRLRRPRSQQRWRRRLRSRTSNFRIVFTNRGAQVKHWILKKYKDTGGKPLDMVQPQASAQFGLPLSLFTYEPALTTQVNQALYQVTPVERSRPPGVGRSCSRGAYLSLRGEWSRRAEDVPLRFVLCGRHRSAGPAQWRAGSCAGRVAGRAGRHGGVWCLYIAVIAQPGAYALLLLMVARWQSGLSGGLESKRQRDARSALWLCGDHRSLLCRRIPARRSRAHIAGHAAQHHQSADRPERSQQPEEAGRCAGLGRWRYERRYQAAAVRRAESDGRAGIDPHDRSRRQTYGADRCSRSFSLAG